MARWACHRCDCWATNSIGVQAIAQPHNQVLCTCMHPGGACPHSKLQAAVAHSRAKKQSQQRRKTASPNCKSGKQERSDIHRSQDKCQFHGSKKLRKCHVSCMRTFPGRRKGSEEGGLSSEEEERLKSNRESRPVNRGQCGCIITVAERERGTGLPLGFGLGLTPAPTNCCPLLVGGM